MPSATAACSTIHSSYGTDQSRPRPDEEIRSDRLNSHSTNARDSCPPQRLPRDVPRSAEGQEDARAKQRYALCWRPGLILTRLESLDKPRDDETPPCAGQARKRWLCRSSWLEFDQQVASVTDYARIPEQLKNPDIQEQVT